MAREKMRRIYNVGRQIAGYCERSHMGAYAAQGAFFIIVSAIPFFMVFGRLLQFFSDRGTPVANRLLEWLPEYLEPFVIFLLREAYGNHPALFSVTAVVACWSAGKGVWSITEGLSSARGIAESRNWVQLRLWSVLHVFVLMVLTVLLAAATLFLPMSRIWLFFALCGGLPIVFQFLPRDRTAYLQELPGGILCAAGWYLLSWGMRVYIRYFKGFSMYGRLGAVVVVMLWLYLCMYLLLFSSGLRRQIYQKCVDMTKVEK